MTTSSNFERSLALEKELGQYVPFGSAQHKQMLESAFEMTEAEAKQIIAEREKNPLTHPYERYQQAQRLLAQIKAKPKAVSTRTEVFKRDREGMRYYEPAAA